MSWNLIIRRTILVISQISLDRTEDKVSIYNKQWSYNLTACSHWTALLWPVSALYQPVIFGSSSYPVLVAHTSTHLLAVIWEKLFFFSFCLFPLISTWSQIEFPIHPVDIYSRAFRAQCASKPRGHWGDLFKWSVWGGFRFSDKKKCLFCQ